VTPAEPQAIAVTSFVSPYIYTYPWSSTTGFGTKFADPATLPTGNGQGVAFSPSGNAIAVAHSNTPFISAYPWSGAGFGAKFANPATLPGAFNASGAAFNPAGTAIAVAHGYHPSLQLTRGAVAVLALSLPILLRCRLTVVLAPRLAPQGPPLLCRISYPPTLLPTSGAALDLEESIQTPPRYQRVTASALPLARLATPLP
jgi:hypothetical protein